MCWKKRRRMLLGIGTGIGTFEMKIEDRRILSGYVTVQDGEHRKDSLGKRR